MLEMLDSDGTHGACLTPEENGTCPRIYPLAFT